MRFEPPIDHARLIEAVRDAYGISPVALEFLPLGFGASYKVATAEGVRYFLKVWPYLRLGEPAAQEQLASLAPSDALAAHVPALGVPRPLSANAAALYAELDGILLALFPFLEGRAGAHWTRDVHAAIGGAFAALHRATPLLADLVTRRDALDIAWEPELRRLLQAATGIEAPARAGLLAAREWVLASRAAVDAQLMRLHELQAAARSIECARVLCHTDLHGNNVLIDDAGRLSLLDWDDARLAPPEHDLWSSVWESEEPANVRTCIEAYQGAGGVTALHLEHFAFYLLRRYLEDFTIALGHLFDSASDPRDDDHWLRGLDGGPARWSRLDGTLAVLAAALDETGP